MGGKKLSYRRTVLLIIDLNSGGAEWQLARLAESIHAHEMFSILVVGMNGRGEVYKWLKNRGIPTCCLDYSRPFQIWKLIKLFRVFRSFKPDILHTWMFHANILGKIVGKLCGIRYILASLRTAEKERPHHVTLERSTAFLNDRILCNSTGVRNFAARRGFPQKKLKVIPNSFDSTLFHFSRRNYTYGNSFKILFLGRINPQKGLEYLIDAAAQLKSWNHPFTIDLTGKTEEPYRSQLRRQIETFAVESIVFWKPPIKHTQIPDLLSQYHLLVLPSLWEGMPNVIMEAFATGLPVVATRIGGTNDLVTHQKTGLLVPPSNSRELADRICYAMENYETMQGFAENARDHLLSNYSHSTIRDAYFGLYESLGA